MFSIDIPAAECYDDETGEFHYTNAVTLRLEHSLVSISKWESKWHKPFLVKFPEKTPEESIDYIRCMTLNQNVDPNVYYAITPEIMSAINRYIESSQTATTVRRPNSKANRDVVTSEYIYYMMAGYGIPFECQKWHLSRLMALLEIFDVKTNPGKKMPVREIQARNKALNDARRKKLGTKG